MVGAMKDPDDISIEDFRAALHPDAFRSRRERRQCHIRGERQLLENLPHCAGSKDCACPNRTHGRKNPSTGETE